MDNQNLTPDPNLPNAQNPAVTKTLPQAQETPAASPSPAQQSANPNSIPPGEPNKSDNTHTLIAVLLLLFVYPIGLIYMWAATKWPRWVKIVLSLPVLLAIVGIALAVLIAVKSPGKPPTPSSSSIQSLKATPTPTVDPTSNWKTYANNGYSIKYPASWTIEELPQDVKNLNSIFLEEDSTHAATLSFSTDKFSSIYPEYINNQNNPKITINGYDAYKDIGFAGKGAFYIVNSNEEFINISPGTLSDAGLFDKILSTFKFIQ